MSSCISCTINIYIIKRAHHIKREYSVPVIFLELSFGSLYLMNHHFSCYLLHQVGLCPSEPKNDEKTINSRF